MPALIGIIQDAAINTITITADGKNLSFGTKSMAGDLIIGSSVRVYYTDTFNGTDTSKARVTRPESNTATGTDQALVSILFRPLRFAR